MTSRELHDEAFIAHRELHAIRAAAKARPRRRLSRAEFDRRRRYAAHRQHKLNAARREVDGRREAPDAAAA